MSTKEEGRVGRFGRWIPIVLLKFMKALKAFKSIAIITKLAKVWVTLASMALSVITYAFALGGWAFAIGLVAMLFFHEMGHVWAMRLKGFKAKAPLFIPMLGAVIFAPPIDDREDEAYIGYAGPFWGTVAAMAVFGLALLCSGTFRTMLLLTAYIGFFINLFNLVLAVRPLDGGRVTQVVGNWFAYIGLAAILAIIWITHNEGLILILIIITMEFNWPVWVRRVICTFFMVLLLTIAIAGIGVQPWFIEAIDVALAGFVLLLLWGADEQTLEESRDRRPNLVPWPRRLMWLTIWAGSCALLIAFIHFNLPLLPADVRPK